MQGLGKIALLAGLASVVIGVISRLTMTPVLGVESYAMFDFAKVCVGLSIAASLATCKK